MITANIAKILAGEYNEQFNALLKQISQLALNKYRDMNIDFSRTPYNWIEKLGFPKFKEVMTALGYEVFDNKTSYKIRW